MKGDFTRSTFHPEKQYRTVRMQQGRVQLDADWNEQQDIFTRRLDVETMDIIGASGAPRIGGGFLISNAGSGSAAWDFKISSGRFYVDGILCENDDASLQYSAQPEYPASPIALASGRYIVYLDVWERHITALDDSAIRETALGGPDTATRAQIISQVKTLNVGASGSAFKCGDTSTAWTNLIAPSTGTLAARAKPDATAATPCIIPPGAGYRRLENQLYRVEIHTPSSDATNHATYKWSRDNGSVVAGVQTVAGNAITLTSLMPDAVLGFAPDQWIELLDDRHDLLGVPGMLARIASVLDNVITIDASTIMLPAIDPRTGFTNLHSKIRRWDSAGALSVHVPSGNNGFIALEDGVEIKFDTTTSYNTGDYWTIPVRTNTNSVEWPGTPAAPAAQLPFGIAHHFARLAIIDFNGTTLTVIDDCRKQFYPLTELEPSCCCCTVTVGSGDADYKTITDALAALPADGGEICVMPGEYTDNVVIQDCDNIYIHGCGDRSVINSAVAAAGATASPVFTIINSTNITIDSLAVEADATGIGILVDDSLATAAGATQGTNDEYRKFLGSHTLTFSDLLVEVVQQSAFEIHDANLTTICDCNIVMDENTTVKPAIFYSGAVGVIEGNTIISGEVDRLVERDGMIGPSISGAVSAATSGAASGIQIGGGSEDVRVRCNTIQGLSGQGITLGSLNDVDTKGKIVVVWVGWGLPSNDPCANCTPPTHNGGTYTGGGTTVTRQSAGDLYHIEISDNRIFDMGLDGIGVVNFFLTADDDTISVHNLLIDANEIRGCMSRAFTMDHDHAAVAGFGGIALADVDELVIRNNVIAENSTDQTTPFSGIFILHGAGIVIEHNRIMNNGMAIGTTDVDAFIGYRGGITIVYAATPLVLPQASPMWRKSRMLNFENDTTDYWSVPPPNGFPAAVIHGNIVGAPLGTALMMQALGPVSIVGNSFTTSGILPVTKTVLDYLPQTVFIINMGRSSQLLALFSMSEMKGMTLDAMASYGGAGLREPIANGNVLFADNQCMLDLRSRDRKSVDVKKRFLLASVLVASLDDVGFENNQSDCAYAAAEFMMIADAVVIGITLRAIGNRLKEPPCTALLSLFTFGLMNTTTNNQGTHCILPYKFSAVLPAFVIDGNNLALTIYNNEKYLCPNIKEYVELFKGL